MALSRYQRFTQGKTRTSRPAFPAVLLALLLGASLALSACGAQQAGAAAIVDGTAISDQDVQTVSDQVNTLATGGQKLSSRDALLNLILAPYVIAEAKRVGKTVSASQARQALAKVADPSPSTIEFVQMQLAIQQLDQASQTSIVSELGHATITVNPRYGTFDAKQIVLTPTSPNWIKATATSPAPTPTQ